MSLAERLAALASRVGLELKGKIGATHPGLARAWVCFGFVGAQVVVRAQHNVASVVRTGTGRYRVTFATPMPDAHYCWTALARSSTDSGTLRLAVVRASADLKHAAFVDISCATTATAFADSTEINLAIYR
ncbi:hypothetical protein [Serpentinimonas maccroryi]|uniref:hypothetical protein n=1 Tax=Serpentinimonas maccroryi TaxID=1458426 RepID=UPI0020337B2C|nr:hypothetical protein [Serpentinimonas maccroryi]MCM2479197.1 hypothetical protein [Serpentinimonas maccroryi]